MSDVPADRIAALPFDVGKFSQVHSVEMQIAGLARLGQHGFGDGDVLVRPVQVPSRQRMGERSGTEKRDIAVVFTQRYGARRIVGGGFVVAGDEHGERVPGQR